MVGDGWGALRICDWDVVRPFLEPSDVLGHESSMPTAPDPDIGLPWSIPARSASQLAGPTMSCGLTWRSMMSTREKPCGAVEREGRTLA
jgi:hypothetical protein